MGLEGPFVLRSNVFNSTVVIKLQFNGCGFSKDVILKLFICLKLQKIRHKVGLKVKCLDSLFAGK